MTHVEHALAIEWLNAVNVGSPLITRLTYTERDELLGRVEYHWRVPGQLEQSTYYPARACQIDEELARDREVVLSDDRDSTAP